MSQTVATASVDTTTRSSVKRLGLAAEILLLILLSGAILWGMRQNSTNIAGGSDSYGYVSEALRILRGHLAEPERVFSVFGLAENSALSAPLGYRPLGADSTLPTYPFGYPLLMAAAMLVGGFGAAFWVTPVLGTGAVLVTYLVGRARRGRLAGLIAAALVLIFPNYLYAAFQPMSDVPATFFAAVALFALLRPRPRLWSDLLLGVAVGLGVWVRPNMALVALPIVGLLLWRREWRRFVIFALVCAPFVLVEALMNQRMYGAPWATGYGVLPWAPSLEEAGARALRHLGRLQEQQAGVGLVLAAVGFALGRMRWSERLTLGAVCALFLGFFAFYAIDDAWWYGRFLLPALPAVALVEADALARVAEVGRFRFARVAVLAVGAAAFVWVSSGFWAPHGVFDSARSELRYPLAADLVRAKVQQPAVILSMQHSGSLRLYSGLPTARWDRPLQELLPKLAEVTRAGGNVYLLDGYWALERVRYGEQAALMVGAEEVGRANTDQPDQVVLYKLNLMVEPPQPPSSVRPVAQFGGEMALQSYQITSGPIRPGGTVSVSLYWEALATPTHDYKVFVHLLDASGKTVAQADHYPFADQFPTTHWAPGYVLGDRRDLQVPADTPPGPLRVSVGLYRPDTMEQVEPRDRDGKTFDYPFVLQTVTVAGQ